MTSARPDDETRSDVCAQCKGVIGDLPDGREPEEFCDTCHEDAVANLASMPVSGDVVEKARTVRDAALQALRACEADEGHFAAVAAATHAALKNLEGEEK